MHPPTRAYAIDENGAEKADRKGPDSHESNADTTPVHHGAVEDHEHANTDGFRRNAKIWSLYLKEAEEEAKDRAELWKTGLDSLLVFAGLFAGVVSSFVLDARQDLQENTQQAVLNKIFDVLNHTSSPDINAFAPSTLVLWVNGLWFSSLLTTLFSALMAVLAKGWIVKFIPVTSRQESKEAYQRRIRDEKAQSWYLEGIISVAPLLLQISLLSFCVGLGLRTLGDNQSIGDSVIILVGVGICGYVIMTFLPIFDPTCPFDTTFSDVFLLYKRVKRSSEETPPKLGLAQIWKLLIRSANPTHVDEGIAELARGELNNQWRRYFLEDGAPAVILKRLKDIMSAGFHDKTHRYEILCNHLQALSQFVYFFQNSKNDLQKASVNPLSRSFHDFVEPGNPLNRWNDLPDETRALAFSVRTPILLDKKKDMLSSEVDERPWETIIYSMLPTHKRNLLMGACQGLVGQLPHLREVSAMILILSMARGMEDGLRNSPEWLVSQEKRQQAEDLAWQYLAKLSKVSVEMWRMMTMEALTKSPLVHVNWHPQEIPLHSFTGNQMPLVYSHASFHMNILEVVERLVENGLPFHKHLLEVAPKIVEIAVTHSKDDVRKRARKLCESLALKNDTLTFVRLFHECLEAAWGAPERNLRQHALGTVIEIVKDDGIILRLSKSLILEASELGDDVMPVGIEALTEISQTGILSQETEEKLRMALHTSLTTYRHPSPIVVDRVIEPLLTLGRDLKSSLESVISGIVSMSVNDDHRELREQSTDALKDLMSKNIFPQYIQDTFERTLGDALKSPDPKSRDKGIARMEELASDKSLRHIAKAATPSFIDMWVKNGGSNFYKTGVKFLASFANQAVDASDHWKNDFPISYFWDFKAGDVIIKELQSADNEEEKLESLKYILLLLNADKVSDDIIAKLMDEYEALSKDSSLQIRTSWLIILPEVVRKTKIYSNVFFRATRILIEAAFLDKNDNVRDIAIQLVANLITYEPNNVIESSIGELIEYMLRADAQWEIEILSCLMTLVQSTNDVAHTVKIALSPEAAAPVREAGVKLWLALIRCSGFNPLGMDMTEILKLSMNKSSWSVRECWAEILSHIAKSDKPSNASSRLIDVVFTDDYYDLVSIGLKSLVSLASEDKLNSQDRQAILEHITRKEKALPWVWTEFFIDILGVLIRTTGLLEGALANLLNAMNGPYADSARETLISVIDNEEHRTLIKREILRILDYNEHTNHSNLAMADGLGCLHAAAVECLGIITVHSEDNIRQLMELSMSDKDECAQAAAIRALTFIVKQGKSQVILRSDSAKDMMTLKTPALERARTAWTEMLCVLFQKAELPFALGKLIDLSLVDDKTQVREAAARSIASLMEDGASREALAVYIPKLLLGIKRENVSSVRLAWVNVLKSFCKYGIAEDSIYLLLDWTTKDDDEMIKEYGARTLAALLVEVNLREPIKAHVNNSISALDKVNGWNFRTAWVVLLTNLAKYASSTDALCKLLEVALKDSDPSIRYEASSVLPSLLQDEKLYQDSVKPYISRATGSSIKEESRILRNWIQTLTVLASKDNHSDYVPRLVKLAMESYDDTFGEAMKGLCSLASDAKLAEAIKGVLSPGLKSALKEENSGHRLHAIQILFSVASKFTFNEVIKNAVPHVLRVVVSDKNMDVQEAGEGLLRHLHKVDPSLQDTILLALPEHLPVISPTGMEIVLRLVETLSMEAATLKTVAYALVPGLTDASTVNRRTAIRLLEALFKKYASLVPEVLQPVVKEIVKLAIEDNDDDVRLTALQLIATIPQHHVLRDKIKTVLPQLLQLLQQNRFVRPIVELLSSIASDNKARKEIIGRIISVIVTQGGVYPDGISELLTQLLADKRFDTHSKAQAEDHVMLLAIPLLAKRPDLTKYRDALMVSLWSNYHKLDIRNGQQNLPSLLIQLFMFTLFGRHVTRKEVEVWLGMNVHIS